MKNSNAFLQTAKDAALKSGLLLKENFGGKHIISFKSEHDIGLEIDKQSEKIILSILKKKFPSHSIYSEESGFINNDSEYTWFVDPLDGTNNYFAGIAYFGVSIALKQSDDIIVGVVYNPITDQMFTAAKGGGAYLNGEKIIPSSITKLRKAVLSFIRGHQTFDGGDLEKISAELENYLPRHFRRTLTMWAPSLDWCLLASGGIDALVSFESEKEDLYAGLLVAKEAEVEIKSFSGKIYNTSINRIIAANKNLSKHIIELLTIYS